MMIKYTLQFGLFLVVFFSSVHFAETRLPDKLASVDSRMSALELQLKSLQDNNGFYASEIKTLQDSVIDLRGDHSKLEETFSRFIKQYEKRNHSSSAGAILLLLGLMLEIIGAILIASEILTRKLSMIRNLNPKAAMNDLGLDDSAIRDVVGFLTTVGILIVFVGFVTQSMGTLMILNLSILWWVVIGIAMIGTAFVVIHFVSGRSIEQTSAEKIRILCSSFYYSFIKPLLFKWWRGVLCDYCRGPVMQENVHVAFIFRDNSHEYPFLNTPCSFVVGHKNCLLKCQTNELNKMCTRKQENEFKSAQKCMNRNDFLVWYKTIADWHEQWRSHWAALRDKDLGEGSWFVEMRNIKTRLGR